MQAVNRKYEQIKKRAYKERIREVEHATFTRVVLSATGDLVNLEAHLKIKEETSLKVHHTVLLSYLFFIQNYSI